MSKSPNVIAVGFRVDQLETLAETLSWLIDKHDRRIGDVASSGPNDQTDRLALKISRRKLEEIAMLIDAELRQP